MKQRNRENESGNERLEVTKEDTVRNTNMREEN